MIKKFRKKPVEIQAVQWTGDNAKELDEFCRDRDRHLNQRLFDPDSIIPDKTAEVYDTLHSSWVPLATGDWIIRGVKGEFYPCEADVFAATYEEVQE